MQRMITKSIESARKGETQEFGLFRTYLGSLYQNHLLTGEVKRRAAETQCPALILHSTEDTILSHENAVLIHKLLGSPDKKLQLIDGCDHVMTVDLKKREVAQMVDDFIAQHSRLQNKAVKLAD
jgi:alpha-beta hydrolase superfamily lysophospholipase